MGAPEQDDLDLLRATARGDRDGLAGLYDRHAGLLLALATRMLAQEEAEEILHDVFLEIWQHAGDYDPRRGSVRTWLVVRMRSRCLDRLKAPAQKRRRTLEAIPDGALVVESRESDGAPLRRALHELSAEQREVVLLGYFEGLSSSEISARIGIPQGTVKSRLAAALHKLREVLRVENGR